MGYDKKFYKALLKEPYMKSQYSGMTFEIGKTYKIPKHTKLQMYDDGFHFTDNIYLLPLWYTPGEYYIFEVFPGGQIHFDDVEHKYCSEELTIIKQLSEHEINDLYDETRNDIIYNENPYFRKAAVRLGRTDDLKILINDSDYNVKLEFINSGHTDFFNTLVYDSNKYIRGRLAIYGRDEDLDILINDESIYVRMMIASHSTREQDLVTLIHDINPLVSDTAQSTLNKQYKTKIESLYQHYLGIVGNNVK